MKGKYLFMLLLLLNINILLSKKLTSFLNDAICEDYKFLATEENVKITGRFYQNDDVTWIVYSGSAIEFYASGNYAELFLVGDNNIFQEPDYRPRYAIYVDDKPILDTKINDFEFTIQFKISNDDTAKSIIKVMLLSEAQNGGVGIKAIKINSCSIEGNIIVPVEKKKLSIEFIGDSITCAYGVDAPDQSYSFTTTTENFSKSYAYLASQKLDADYSIVALSGHGIVSGYSSGDKWADGVVPLYYTKISKNDKYPGDWDFEHHKYDVVLINLADNLIAPSAVFYGPLTGAFLSQLLHFFIGGHTPAALPNACSSVSEGVALDVAPCLTVVRAVASGIGILSFQFAPCHYSPVIAPGIGGIDVARCPEHAEPQVGALPSAHVLTYLNGLVTFSVVFNVGLSVTRRVWHMLGVNYFCVVIKRILGACCCHQGKQSNRANGKCSHNHSIFLGNAPRFG